MNKNWKTFLLSQQALANDEYNFSLASPPSNIGNNSIYPLPHFGILSVTGKDAAKLLQGQITCNVNDISETQSSLAAMCNPKGRVIATFLLAKKIDTFLLVLPIEMLETVRKRLHMFILRSDAKITDSSDEFCLMGLNEPVQSAQFFATENHQDILSITIPALNNRKLLMSNSGSAISLWSNIVASQGYQVGHSDEWNYLDILSGIPWVTTTTSEEFIPQMLNLDKLGGISFTKGCYTGQEIVARTHYLGKSKREMFLAECQTSTPPYPNSTIVELDGNQQEAVGKVLVVQASQQDCKMLVILQNTETAFTNLGLQDAQTKINLLPFNT